MVGTCQRTPAAPSLPGWGVCWKQHKVTSGQPEADVRPVSDDGAGKVFLHFTMSLDGFIADTEGRLDWAFRFAGPAADAVTQLVGSIGAALGGRRGYDRGMMRGEAKLYGGAWSGPQFVLTHRCLLWCPVLQSRVVMQRLDEQMRLSSSR
jgi:hypothetical protein